MQRIDPRAHSPNRSPGEGEPPAGAPWDLPLAEAPLAFVDLEMTGLRVGDDRVIEICIERVRNGVVEDRLETVVDPGVRGNEHVHGIDEIAFEGAPTFAAVAERAATLLDGAIFVAHGAIWDMAFLQDELARVGLGERAPVHAIDTAVLCRRAFHLLTGYGLQSVAAALGVPVARAHRAGDDVATMRAVFQRVLAELAPATARELWHVRVGEHVPRPEIATAVEAAVASGKPVEVTYRPARRAHEHLRLVLTALVPPHAIGYLLPGRGRRQLRLDRILRIDPIESAAPE